LDAGEARWRIETMKQTTMEHNGVTLRRIMPADLAAGMTIYRNTDDGLRLEGTITARATARGPYAGSVGVTYNGLRKRRYTVATQSLWRVA
jgi:hypothetical protein